MFFSFFFNVEITNIRSKKGATLLWWYAHAHTHTHHVYHAHSLQRYMETQEVHKRFQLMRFLLSIVTTQHKCTRCFFILIWSSKEEDMQIFQQNKKKRTEYKAMFPGFFVVAFSFHRNQHNTESMEKGWKIKLKLQITCYCIWMWRKWKKNEEENEINE